MPGFDPSSASPVFDPSSAQPASASGGFDPGSAKPVGAAAPRAHGATGFFDQIGQTFSDLTNPNHPQHDPNALESGIIGVTYSKPIQSLQGNYESAVTNGLFMQPVRAAMESLGVGRQQGESNASLHQRYSAAVVQARQRAQQQMQDNQVGAYDGNPLHVAERAAQQVGNFGAGIAANPQYFLLPGAGAGGSVGGRIAAAGGINAAIGGASDAAAQIMDMAEGQKKNFDIVQNLQQAGYAGLFGAGMHGAGEAAPVVSDFVKNLFGQRGMDTTPGANPTGGIIQPMTSDHVAMNAADHMQYQQLLQTGSVDDIKNFFATKQGPKPSWSDVNTWVEHRDGPQPTFVNGQPGAPNLEMQPDFNYEQAYNQHAEDTQREANRQAVEQHVQNTMSGWKNAPDVSVVHGPEDIADPAVRDAVLKADPQGTALGLFGSDGKVHMFSGRITDPEVANSVLFHEGLGHYGLSQLFQGKLDQTMVSMADSNVGQFGKLVAERQAANPGESRALSAEEVLAERSQNGQIKPSWQLALNSVVRRFGRKMGMKLDMNDAEVQHVLAMAHDAVVNGKSVRENGFRGATQDPNKFMFTGPHAQEFDPEHPLYYEGQDSHPRNEISDKDAVFHEPINFSNKLGDHLEHPELYKNYPQLRDLPLLRDPSIGAKYGVKGYYDDGSLGHPLGAHIAFDPHDPEARGTILHEVQHAIQDIEGNPDFVRASKNGGTMDDPEYSYDEHPSEREAQAVDARKNMSDWQRKQYPPGEIGPKFMTTDQLGRETTDPEHLDEIDRLKADPRYWQDREFRQNVNELARVRSTQETGPDTNKYITKSQLTNSRATKNNFEPDDIEGIAKHIDEHYDPTVMTRDEVRQKALENGINPDKIKAHNAGELSVRLAKLGYAAQYTADQASKLLEKFDTPDWKPEDHVQLAKIIAQRDALVAQYKGEGNELGRALQTAKMFKSFTNAHLSDVMAQLREAGSGLADLADPTNPNAVKFARQLKEALAGNHNPKGANALMTGVVKPYWEQYLTTFHMNAMLSAFSTHVKAPVDMMTGIGRNVIEKALAMPLGTVRQTIERIKGEPVTPGVEFGELAAHIAGLWSAVTDMEVYRATLHAARTGESSYVTKVADPNNPNQLISQRTPTNFANQFGAVSNPRIPGVSIPTDLISAQDTVFRSTEMNAQLKTVAWRDASADLGPKATFSDKWTLMQHKAANPTPSMLKEAFDETQRTLLLNDNKLNTIINRARTYKPGMTGGERVGAFMASNLAPFIRVESNNLMNRIVQRSPLAVLDGYTREQFKMGGARADIAAAKVLYGTTLLAMYWNMAASGTNGKLTGAGPDNVDKYKERLASGWRPEAVHENGQYNTGGQLGMSVNPFDVHNKTAQIVASARQAWDAGAQPTNKIGSFLMAMGSVFSNLAGMSWISDFQPAVDAARAHGQSAPAAVANTLGGIASTWVPNGLNQAGRLSDPNQRDTTSPDSPILGRIGNEVQQNIPGLRGNLPIKYSVYGDPLANGASLTGVHTIIPGLSGNGTTETQDPAERELDRLSTLTSSAIVTPVQHSISVDPNDSSQGKIALKPAQFEEYQRLAGKSIVYYVQQDLDNGSWAKMSDAERVAEVRDIETDSKKAAAQAIRDQIK